MTPRPLAVLATCALAATGLDAQQAQPPIRALDRVVATSTESLGSVTAIRIQSNGAVLVNDSFGHRLVLLDSQFHLVRTVLDASSGTAHSYGDDAGGLLAYRGDSSVFVDPTSSSMLVISPAGDAARVMALPPNASGGDLTGTAATATGFDPDGRLVFRDRSSGPLHAYNPDDPDAPAPDNGLGLAPIVRVNLATRATDTLAYVVVVHPSSIITRSEAQGISVRLIMNPMPTTDDWVLMSDGTVMIVRGRDFHLEHVWAPARVDTFPRLPFEWQRLTMEKRQWIVDSARDYMARLMASVPTMSDARGRSHRPTIDFTPAGQLPGYRPAFFPGTTRAAPDGRVWIRTSLDSPSGPVYDVVDTAGVLVDRVRLPRGRVLLAVAPHGVIYMAMRDLMGSVHLEKALMK
ncbi:MAG TPA: hypothetical protein VFK16_12065 [Gemmatimonadaceae bacterium]|jgi:hypothetical protein|nr:hypothetical protein [Gemmatimonadaceae bacterium]